MHGIARSFVFLSALTLAAGTAHADDIGEFGTPAGLQIVADTADTYLQYHGRLYVKNANGGLDEYRWGGTSCGARILTEAEVAALQAAVDNKKMRVQPITQPGQGQALCLVSFDLVPKQFLKLVNP